MKTTDTKHYRQGDVIIERIATIPSEAVKQKPSARIILAQGEVTGHHHALEIETPVEWFVFGEIAPINHKPDTLVGELYVLLPSGGVVNHPEHSSIKLPAGNFRIIRQREYSPEAIRNVAD